MTKKELFDSIGAKINIDYNRCDTYFPDDKEPRNIYEFTISYNGKEFSGEFGDSLSNTERGIEPEASSLIDILQWWDPGNYHDFCSDFGYTEGWTEEEIDEIYANADYDPESDEDFEEPEMTADNCKSYKVYEDVLYEYKNLLNVFGEELMEQFVYAE